MIKITKETVHVNSMAIDLAEYDYANEILDLKFNTGKTYSYIGVPTNTFLSMKYSESIGKFINKHIIKNNKYEYAFKKEL